MTNDVMADLMIKFFLMGSGDAVAGSSRFISPIDHIFLSLIVMMDNFFVD